MPISPTVAAIRDRQDHLRAVLSTERIARLRPRSLRAAVRSLLRAADLVAPDLVDTEHTNAFILLAEQTWQRPLWTWDGEGGLRGLMSHLLVVVRYPLPDFLFQLPANAYPYRVHATHRARIRLLAHLGLGGSMQQARALRLIPACLTRRMQHQLLLVKDACSLSMAVRGVQIQTFGGPGWLYLSLNDTRLAQLQDDEAAWQPIIAWMCRSRPEDLATHTRTLVDYLFSLPAKERSRVVRSPMAAAVRRAQAWHNALPRYRTGGPRGPLPASGLPDGTFEQWTVRQIRTGEELAQEGAELQHCVATYWNSVMSRRCAIFSLKRAGFRCITVEVRLSEGSIVQARGMRNRQPTAEERGVLQTWASDSGLRIQST